MDFAEDIIEDGIDAAQNTLHLNDTSDPELDKD